jgi:hypothetical protein
MKYIYVVVRIQCMAVSREIIDSSFSSTQSLHLRFKNSPPNPNARGAAGLDFLLALLVALSAAASTLPF